MHYRIVLAGAGGNALARWSLELAFGEGEDARRQGSERLGALNRLWHQSIRWNDLVNETRGQRLLCVH